MGAIGRPLVPAPPGGAGELVDLQRRVLGAVARCRDRVAAGDAAAARAGDPQAERVADGLRILLAALPAIGVPTGPEPGGATDTAALLVRAGEVLDGVAEASRRAAVAFAVVGQEVAADIADSLMTVALALRMLVEIARGAPGA